MASLLSGSAGTGEDPERRTGSPEISGGDGGVAGDAVVVIELGTTWHTRGGEERRG